MTNVSAVQHYVVEIDGVHCSEHARFVDAIKTGLPLHEQNPEFKSNTENAVLGFAA